MVLMAIDHVRVYSGVPAGGPTAGDLLHALGHAFLRPGLRLPRRHRRVPARAQGRRARGAPATSSPAAWLLVLMEVTIIRLSWTFTLASLNTPLAGVIWMLGWCMVLMAGLVRLPLSAITVIGLVLVVGQDIVGGALAVRCRFVGPFLYAGGEVQLGAAGPTFSILYTIIPWIGVMALGYAFGAIVVRPAEERHRACVRIGLAATATFLVVGGAAGRLFTGRRRTSGAVPAAESAEVSGLAVVPADDPRPADRAAAAGRAGPRLVGAGLHDVRPGADVLLPAAHSVDSWARADGLEDSRRPGQCRVVCFGSVRCGASGAALEPGAALPRLRRRDRGCCISRAGGSSASRSGAATHCSATSEPGQLARRLRAGRCWPACLFSGRGTRRDGGGPPPSIRRSGSARRAPAAPTAFPPSAPP